jgi:intracellular sulfur oxidation DsrE/DsrF family protein
MELSTQRLTKGYTMRIATLLVSALLVPVIATAQQATSTGPIVPSFGPVFTVEADFVSPPNIDYKVAFEVAQGSTPARLNTTLTSVARFLNMHGQAGIPRAQIGAAAVVHGSAVMDVLNAEAYRGRTQAENPNAALIRELLDAGVEIVVCGQSIASRGIAPRELMEGVTLSLSAMTAFVVLQDRGYRVNPW